MKKEFLILFIISLIISGCTETELETTKRKADIEYYCTDESYFLVDDKCEYKEYFDPVITYNCPARYNLSGYMCMRGNYNISECGEKRTYDEGRCYDLVKAEKVYSCQAGSLEGVKCTRKIINKASERETCQIDEILKEGQCIKNYKGN